MLPQYLIPLLKSTTFIYPETQVLTLKMTEVFKSYAVSRSGLLRTASLHRPVVSCCREPRPVVKRK